MITTGFEILNFTHTANLALKHIIDIDIDICINIEIVQSNNSMINKL